MFGNDMLQFSGMICNALMVHLTMSHLGCRRRSHWTSSLPIHGTLDLKLKNGETRKALKHNKGRVSENLTWPYMAHIPNSWKLNLHYEFRMFWIDCSKWINPQLVCCFVAVIKVVIAALPGLCFSPVFFPHDMMSMPWTVHTLQAAFGRNGMEPGLVPLNHLTMPYAIGLSKISQRKSDVFPCFPSKKPMVLVA